MNQAGCPKGFFVGDDETDEDVFRLDHESIFTVRVGGGGKPEASLVSVSTCETSRKSPGCCEKSAELSIN